MSPMVDSPSYLTPSHGKAGSWLAAAVRPFLPTKLILSPGFMSASSSAPASLLFPNRKFLGFPKEQQLI